MATSAARARIAGECNGCGRRFNFLAPAGKSEWSGKCAGCGLPITAKVAGHVDPEPPVKSAIPKATYRPKQKEKAADAPDPAQKDTPAGEPTTGGNAPIPPATATGGAGTEHDPGAGEPAAAAGAPDSGTADDDKPGGRAPRKGRWLRSRPGGKRTGGAYDHIGLPY